MRTESSTQVRLPALALEVPEAYKSEPPRIFERPPSSSVIAVPLAADGSRDASKPPTGDELPDHARKRSRRAPLAPIASTSGDSIRKPSIPDPMDALFDGAYELNFIDTVAEAAEICAAVLVRALKARAVTVWIHDAVRRQSRVVGASGDGAKAMLGVVESDDDGMTSMVIRSGAPLSLVADDQLPLRLSFAARSVVAVPVIAWERCTAFIEIVDADERVADCVVECAEYIAERLSEFLADRAAA